VLFWGIQSFVIQWII